MIQLFLNILDIIATDDTGGVAESIMLESIRAVLKYIIISYVAGKRKQTEKRLREIDESVYTKFQQILTLHKITQKSTRLIRSKETYIEYILHISTLTLVRNVDV